MNDLLEIARPIKDNVLFVDRTGKIISIHLFNEIKIMKAYHSESLAQKHYRELRKELEGRYVGEGD